jgi:hypothetical protein
MSDNANPEPLEFFKNMWSSMGIPLPGIVTPTLDTDELGKRIQDLKAVEGWLKTNLGMLQMSIHSLEMQRTTLSAMQAMGQNANGESGANPFTNPALWPWPFVPQAQNAATPASTAQAAPTPASDKPA